MLAGTGNCQNHYNPLLSLSSLFNFPCEIPPNTSILLDVVDVVFLIRILPSSNPLCKHWTVIPLHLHNLDSITFHGHCKIRDLRMVLYHTHHTKTIISPFARAYKPGILCACRPGLTGWHRPINIPGYLSHIPPRLATKQRRSIPAPHPVNHRMHRITSLSPWVHIQNLR
jgi:hypothetical protein